MLIKGPILNAKLDWAIRACFLSAYHPALRMALEFYATPTVKPEKHDNPEEESEDERDCEG